MSWIFLNLAFTWAIGISCDIPDATPIVGANDSVYILLEKLQNQGVISHTILNQNTLSEREIYRLLKDADAHADTELSGWVKKEMNRLEQRICSGREFRFFTPERVSFAFDSSNSARDFQQNGIGRVRGVYDPLHRNDFGARFFNGQQFSSETGVAAQSLGFLAMDFSPRFEAEWDSKTDRHQSEIFVRRLSANLTWRNVELVFGREQLLWGPTREGGLLSTTNVRPIDQVRLSSSRPFHLPGFLKYIGLMKYSIFLANAGSNRENDYSYLFGWKASISPSPYFEFGFGRTLFLLGERAPSMSFVPFLREAFYTPKNFRADGSGTNSTDQRWNLDMSVRVPSKFPFTWYNEFAIDDGRKGITKNFENMMDFFQDQVAVKSGLFLSRFFDPRFSFRFEFQTIPGVFYRHGRWQDGYTLSEGLIGEAYGSQSRSYRTTLEYAADRDLFFSGSFAYIDRPGDIYRQAIVKSGGIRRILIATNNPDEKSFVFESAGRVAISNQWVLRSNLGLEFARNYQFVSKRNRMLYRSGIGLDFKF